MTTNFNPNAACIDNEITFGVELEYGRIGKLAAARAVATVLRRHGLMNEAASNTTNTYRCKVVMTDGRIWNIVSDCTVSGCETVSPPMTFPELPIVQEIVRELRANGARYDSGGGLHIHIGMQNWTDKQMANLMKIMNKNEALIHAMVTTREDRISRWCNRIPQSLIACVDQRKTPTKNEMVYANGYSRYMGVNLRSMSRHGTVEFRLFECTTHAGKVRAAVEMLLAICTYARRVKRASSTRREVPASNMRYACNYFLKMIGLKGADFKTCRTHMLRHLEGDSGSRIARSENQRQPAPIVRN